MSRPVFFLAFANDRVDGARFLRSLNGELKALRGALTDERGLAERGEARWDVVDVLDATIDDVFRGVQRYGDRLALFHYGGHAGDFALLLQSANGGSVAANADGLAKLLGGRRSLQCVFLNGCSTEGQVRDLLAAGVPAVIATRREIEDELAVEFARDFYGGLAAGASLGRAFADAEAALRMKVAAPVAAMKSRGIDVSNDAADTSVSDRVPWTLHVAPGAEIVREWSVGVAAGDPLFGLPPLPARDLPPSPFRHLRWFTRDDAELFFGRGREIHRLYETVTATNAAPVTLLHGQSGAGKSSLLDAGLRPRLDETYDVRYARRDEAIGCVATLVASLGAEPGTSLGDAWRARESRSGRRVVAILDQIEEAFTRPRDDGVSEIDALAGALAETFRSPERPAGRLVLGFRKEWLAEIARRLAEARVPYQEVFLDRLDSAGIVDAMLGPTRALRLRQHYAFDVINADELATVVADDLLASRDSAIAPTLQVLLSKMWEHPAARRNGRVVFDRALYERLQQDGILLGDFLDEQLGALGAAYPDAVASGLALDVLNAHTTALGTARARTLAELRESYAHVAASLDGLLERCRELYLLVDAPGGGTTLAHDTLAPLVRRRYATSVLPGQRARHVIDARANEWAQGAVGRTLDAADLALVDAGAAGTTAFSADERRLVEASRDACERAVRAQRFRRRAIVAGAVLVTVTGVAAGLSGWRASRAAARARAASIVAASVAEPDPLEAALLLGALAGEPEPDGGLAAALRIAATAMPSSATSIGEALGAATMSADGRHIFGMPQYGPIRSRGWRLDSSGATVAAYDVAQPDDSALFVGAVSHDGARVLVATKGDSIGVRDGGPQGSTRWVHVCSHLTGSGQRGAGLVAPSGAWSVCGDTLRVWRDVREPRAAIVRPLGASAIAALDVSLDGRWLAMSNTEGPLVVTPLDGNGSVATWSEVQGADVVKFSDDGRWLVAADAKSTIRVPVGRAGEPTYVDSLRPDQDAGIVVDVDARAILSLGPDRTPTLWRGPGDRIDLPHPAHVFSAAFVDDGRTLVTIAADGIVRRWDVRGPRAARRMPTLPEDVLALSFSADGARVLAASKDGTLAVQVVDAVNDGFLIPPPPHAKSAVLEHWLLDARISPDGHRVLTIAGDDTVRAFSADRAGAPPLRLSVGAALPDVQDREMSLGALSTDAQTVATVPRSHRTPLRVRTVDGFGDTLVITVPPGMQHVAVSARGDAIALAGFDSVDRPEVRLWRRGTLAGVLRAGDWVRHLAFAPDGRTVLITTNRALLWSGDSASVRVLSGPAERVADFALAADRVTYAIAGENDVSVRRMDRPGKSVVIPVRAPSALAFAPDGSRLAVDGADGVRIWPLRWSDAMRALAASSSACLSEDKRRLFLDQTARTARAAWEACERAHGRQPAAAGR